MEGKRWMENGFREREMMERRGDKAVDESGGGRKRQNKYASRHHGEQL